MNKVILIGRLTKDPETRQTQNGEGTTVTRFSIAVDRKFKNASGEYDTDFPNCVAFGKNAEFIDKYFSKGKKIGIVGRLQTGSYTKEDGTRVYTTDVVVDEAEFVESKNAETQNQNTANRDSGFVNIPDTGINSEELPWN